MNRPVRIGVVLRIALPAAFFIILFFSGIFPVEKLFSLAPPASMPAAVVASDVASLTNENRTENDLPALAVSPLLTQAAQLKADDMANNSYYAHTSPDGKSPLYWLNLVGYKYLNAGENLVIDRTTSEQAVDAWMNSPDHRENILRPQFTEIGVGVARGTYEGQKTIYVVEEFGTPYPLSVPVVARPVVKTTPTPNVPVASAAPMEAVPQPTPVQAAPQKTAPESAASIAPVLPAIPSRLSIPTISVPVATHREGSAARSTSTASSTSSATTSSTTTTDFAFALAPEFFAPVSIATGTVSRVFATVPETERAAPGWLAHVSLYLRHILSAL